MRTAVALWCLFAISLPSIAEPTNFRLGLGMLRYDISPSTDYTPKFEQTGVSLLAEFPQDNLHGSRFIIYSQNQDDTEVWGFETQMLLGYGLAQPGGRIYTGPTWYREVMRTEVGSTSDSRVFNGWGWQLGTGWQYQRFTVDIATTYRLAKDYKDELARAGVNQGSPTVLLSNLFVSYQF